MISIPKKELFTNDTVIYKRNKPLNTSNQQIINAERRYLNATYGYNIPTLGDDLLIMSRCLKYKLNGRPDTFKNNLTSEFNNLVFPYQFVGFEITSYIDIETKVVELLKKFYTRYNLETLNGPIYVLLFQAPYLRLVTDECNVEPMSVQFNYHGIYKNQGYYIGGKTDCPFLSKKIYNNKTYVEMYILYPTYNKKGKFVYKNWENIKCNMQSLLKQFHHDASCFIKCKESKKACGCLNSDKPYKARCVGDNGKNNLNKDMYNHGILYMVNSGKASRLVHGNFFGENVKIESYDYQINTRRCNNITNNPSPLLNINFV